MPTPIIAGAVIANDVRFLMKTSAGVASTRRGQGPQA